MADLSLIKFYLSDDLSHLSKKEAQEKIKTKGGIIRENITNDVWYFVTNNPKNSSQPFEKARKLGVLFIDEQEFIKMIE